MEMEVRLVVSWAILLVGTLVSVVRRGWMMQHYFVALLRRVVAVLRSGNQLGECKGKWRHQPGRQRCRWPLF